MKIVKKLLITLVVIILVTFVSLVSIFIYEDRFKKREIYREDSPNKEYVFVLYQVGSPEWPFGPVRAEIRLIDSVGEIVDKKSVWMHNDGAPLYKYNIVEIRWYDSTVEIDCTGEVEHSTTTYVLEFE